jgi:hypothetical protein
VLVSVWFRGLIGCPTLKAALAGIGKRQAHARLDNKPSFLKPSDVESAERARVTDTFCDPAQRRPFVEGENSKLVVHLRTSAVEGVPGPKT